jgi:hypothetical protein
MTPSPGPSITGLSPQQKGLLPRHLMTEQERLKEWLRHYENTMLKVNALCAVLESDGPRMLGQVLRELKLERSEDLVKAMSKKRE